VAYPRHLPSAAAADLSVDQSGLIPAVQYLRMSTEQQRYSFENQSDAIAQYAKANGYGITRTYQDRARSGLHLKGRLGLQTLLADVLNQDRDFQAILVLDVSRWGRFQDLDQGAHYEFVCRAAGVSVIYCAEPFENDGSTKTALIRQLKRLMAAEHSRELSARVRTAHVQQAKLGFRQGGPLIYGVQRVLVDAAGQEICVLDRGRRKAQHDNYTVVRRGSEIEIEVLRRIFRRFVIDDDSPAAIAAELNRDAVPFVQGRPWERGAILRLLQHELMVGVYVYNQCSRPMRAELVRNPQEQWVRVHVFDPIVEPRLFEKAQLKALRHHHHQSPEEMLHGLRKLLKRHGRLSAVIIRESNEVPCLATYRKVFGSLSAAYQAVEYPLPIRGGHRRTCRNSPKVAGPSAGSARP